MLKPVVAPFELLQWVLKNLLSNLKCHKIFKLGTEI